MKAHTAMRRSCLILGFAGLLLSSTGLSAKPPAQLPPREAQWIWSPAHTKESVPTGECYFRKVLDVREFKEAAIEIAADDRYELYVNGRRIGTGEDWRTLDHFDLKPHLVPGRNVLAVEVSNTDGDTAGLVARVVIRKADNKLETHSTDPSWKTTLKKVSNWNALRIRDTQWVPAQSFGELGKTLPWGNETQTAESKGRFKIQPDFQVEWVVQPQETGSLIAMTFNEFGQIIASRENGPVLLISDTNKDGFHDKVAVYCEEVKNCQGLLALNGKLLVIGEGSEGTGLYRLSDKDLDGKIDSVKYLLPFKGTMREHGPHGLVLGPDGLIYIMVGNHSQVDREVEATSPYHHAYEGDIVGPRYEDPAGHATGVKAPGGTVLRTDSEGSFVEVFAGGLRNAYDLAFNRQGDLFTYDSDMEGDLGLPWHRPTRVTHLTDGAELGWRSGWAMWPEYWLDGLPATLHMGPGSPTGMVFYNHFNFPVRYHNALFAGDWTLGRINVIKMEPRGGSYQARSEVFLEGTPLNVTDLEIGPDGWLYFCTGGRDTAGGIYCVRWLGKIPPEVSNLGKGIERAIRQPQLHSAWARQQVAKVQADAGAKWESQLVAIARSPKRRASDRCRALDLLQLLGPFPPVTLLMDLSKDASVEVRTKAAYQMGIHLDEVSASRLTSLLGDSRAVVRRQACESLTRAGQPAPIPRLLALGAEKDRHVAHAARRGLEAITSEQWKPTVLEAEGTRAFLHGAVALLTVDPSPDTANAVIDRCLRLVQGEVHDPGVPPGFISDEDFTDLLRVLQLALHRGELPGSDLPELKRALAAEYPARDATINRELVRLLVYLDEPSAIPQMLEQLSADIPEVDKLQIATHASLLQSGWTADQKIDLLLYYEKARKAAGGQNIVRYIENVSRQFFTGLTETERTYIIENGTRWPASCLGVIAKLPVKLDDATIAELVELDLQVAEMEGEAASRLRTGIVAVLGRSRASAAMEHLRGCYEQEPNRRVELTIGLAQDPAENWALLVRSLPIVDGMVAQEVLSRLATVDKHPESPEAIRQAILAGLRLKSDGAEPAAALLTHWTGQSQNTSLEEWQEWFVQTYPDQPAPELPVETAGSNWTFEELLKHLESPSLADASRGELVFEKAQCFKCHRYGDRGESVGPDLTSVSRRFQKKEILSSILFPSHVISDQYAAKNVVSTDGRVFTGIVVPAGADEVAIMQSNGQKMVLSQDQVEEIVPSSKSVMPDGLLDTLSLEEIADLFAFMNLTPRTQVTSRREQSER